MTGQSWPVLAGPVAVGFDRAAPAYDAGGTEFFTELGARLAAHAAIKAGERVADLGCGTGAALLPAAVAAGPGGHVTGIDASEAMLARAEAAARAGGVAVTLAAGDAADPPLAADSLDVITASSVLQFLPRPRRAVRTWRNLLTPGGRLAVSWGIRQDPAWAPVMSVLDDQVPRQSAPGFEEYLRRPPFNSVDALGRLLAEVGYTGVATHLEPITTTYDSAEQWWAACQGQAPWIVSWRHIPDGVRGAARDAALSMAEGLRGGDGLIRRTLTFGCTVAFKPE